MGGPDDLRRKVLQGNPSLPPQPPRTHIEPQQRTSGGRDYTALPWQDFYEDKRGILTENGDSFNIYSRGHGGPLVLLLHGGGYSGLTWALVTARLLSRVQCRVVAPDLRCHGDTVTCSHDLSLDTLVADITHILDVMNEPNVPVVLMGHSMGGALSIHAAHSLKCSHHNVVALVVIDVVEGSAMEALSVMQRVLRSRPKSFKCMEAAVQWAISSGHTKNLSAARISMPGQVRAVTADEASIPVAPTFTSIGEEEEEGDEDSIREDISSNNASECAKSNKQVWRIDLANTEPYWRGWFQGMSAKFLSAPAAKLLVLAGIDSLDKELTIGSMQGKFQLQLFNKCGHAVQEDQPDMLAETVATFLIRHKLAQPTE